MAKWWQEGALKRWSERQLSYVKYMGALVEDIKGGEWESRWAEIAKQRVDMMARIKRGLRLPLERQPVPLVPTDAQAFAEQVATLRHAL